MSKDQWTTLVDARDHLESAIAAVRASYDVGPHLKDSHGHLLDSLWQCQQQLEGLRKRLAKRLEAEPEPER